MRVAACLALVSTPAHAATQSCLTRAEAGALIAFALPTALSVIDTRCSSTLGQNSYFARSKAELATKFSADASRSRNAGRAALLKLIGAEASTDVPDEALMQAVASGVEASFGTMTPHQCIRTDAALATAATHSASHADQLVELVSTPRARSGRKPPLNLCAD